MADKVMNFDRTWSPVTRAVDGPKVALDEGGSRIDRYGRLLSELFGNSASRGTVVNVKVSPSIWKWFHEESSQRGISMSDLFRIILAEWFAARIPGAVAVPDVRMRAIGDREICRLLGIKKSALDEFRVMNGLPGPHFKCRDEGFTWRDAFERWIAQRMSGCGGPKPKLRKPRAVVRADLGESHG